MGCNNSKNADAVDTSDPPTSVRHTKYDGTLTEDAPDYVEGNYVPNSTGTGWQDVNAPAQNPGANPPAGGGAAGGTARSN